MTFAFMSEGIVQPAEDLESAQGATAERPSWSVYRLYFA